MEQDDDVAGGGPAVRAVAVVVLDDRPVVKLGLQVALEELPEGTRLGELVVVGKVLDAVGEIRSAVERGLVAVVALDGVDRPGEAVAALEAGARGVVLCESSLAELVDVVHRAGRGELAVAAAMAERLEQVMELRRLFTQRELEVLTLYATGLPAKSVARRMDVGLETVKTYLKRLRQKSAAAGLRLDSRLEFAELGRRMDLS
ncbi:DNA-binding response regulator, NarL/FixJ family, contains REC and HTH domains [Quadrisphaera granulorum]|uniref:DNA-binding NarL/FixJ family response regulator n=1 Tax=Quadrisphaera granulorum TaxID=317664 RepID=A0A316ACY4_9ACTN|nr:LuxR C-terminal-related transcriptional regulator [Quadrisphaera granulorum]PWJ55108.1 DNA-binding NarL/FixJ family response regulator [Quadrisphaera granulorum]SZE95617.1 DNA-binding response regulator, NarL/FixJ family, contains REC and HTH domains [Quadrisphaera granulorum]